MKKLFFVCSAVIVLASSCKKNDNIMPVDRETDLAKIEEGRIIFTSNETYHHYLELSNREEFVKSLPGSANFINFKNGKAVAAASRNINGCNVPDEVIENNPAFFDMLDINGTVQIGSYVYRYDYCNKQVWVISAANKIVTSNNSAFMNGAKVSGVVGSFPNYVDVLEAVATGYSDMPEATTVQGNEIFEKNGFLSLGNTTQEYSYINNNEKSIKDQNVLMDGKLAYEAFGFYFHFYGKEKYKVRSLINWDVTTGGRRDWDVAFNYSYRRKGSNSDNSGVGQVSPGGNRENKADKTFYEGSRGLRWGNSKWNVNNMWTNQMRVERNGGSAWSLIGSYFLNSFQFRNNYQFTGFVSYFENNF